MESWKPLYDENFKKVLGELELEYREAIDKAGNKLRVHHIIEERTLKTLNGEFTRDNASYKGQLFTITNQIEEKYDIDKTPFDKAFEEITKENNLDERKEIIIKLSRNEAYSEFYTGYLRERREELTISSDFVKIVQEIVVEGFKDIISEFVFNGDFSKWLDEHLKNLREDLIENVKGLNTITEQYNFLLKEREIFQAKYFPDILENKLLGNDIEPKTKEIIEKTNKVFSDIFSEYNIIMGIKPEILELKTEAKDNATLRQQVLAMYYLMDEFKVCTTDKTEIARFIQFLTGKGKNIQKIHDTNIYKFVKTVLSKKANKDLLFIRAYFEKMGMTETVKKIDGDIEKK